MDEPQPTRRFPAAAGRRQLLTVAALAAVVFTMIAADAVAGRPAPVPAASAVGGPIRWGRCDPPGPRLQCARVRVPLDWVHPNRRTIQLAVIRHRSRAGLLQRRVLDEEVLTFDDVATWAGSVQKL